MTLKPILYPIGYVIWQLEAVEKVDSHESLLAHDSHWWNRMTMQGKTQLPRGANLLV